MNSITLSEKDIARFWSKVKIGSPDECWEWQGKLEPHGYGSFFVKNKVSYEKRNPRTHRVSWIIHFGDIPKGKCVCHKCDNGSCVNPKHLFLGTQLENIHDMVEKGRNATGENQGSAKLRKKDVILIRKMLALGITQRTIAKEFRITQDIISKISRRILWKHII